GRRIGVSAMDAVRRQRDRFVIRLGAFVLAVFGAQGWAAPERPNVLVVLTDDAGYSDPACYGGEASTPNIDRLAREGGRFRTFYTNARCSPTRACLRTGRWPTAVGVGDLCKPRLATSFPGYLGHLDPSAVTLAEVLSDAGYRTWMSGKWHLGGDRVDGEDGTPAEGEREKWPTRRGFQRFFGVVQGETGHFEPTAAHPFRRGEEVVDVPDDFYSTDAITDEAV